ncbi:MAG: hypothetical protein NW206_19345 [Hyphomonadaceae bacterium]|nr:hypothetical protein [Hyphomonadaceae bacterium]
MRSLILAAAALVAVAAPGVALAQTGYADVSYTNVSTDTGFGDDDADGWAAGGAVAFDAYALGVQLDAGYSNTSADSGGDVDSWSLGGHVFKRYDNFLVGGFAGVGNVDADSAGDSDYWTVGAEGQYYFERTTLDASLSYTEADDADLSATALNLGATHFYTDNFSINAGVGFASLENDAGDDADLISYGVGAEYQFAALPVSVFGGYTHSEVDDFDTESDALTVGVRYNWGGTLYDRNRSGASLSRVGLGGFLGLL